MKDFDFVATHKPVNGSAAAVVCKGEHFEPDKMPGCYHSDKPLPVERFKGPRKDNLTGKKFGKFTVIGYLGKFNRTRGTGRWLVQCSCGWYEIRAARVLRNTEGNDEELRSRTMCHECNFLESIKTDKYRNKVKCGSISIKG